VQLDAEMPVIERSQEISTAGIVHHQRDVVANKRGMADRPL
jgi:hypothetical protein